MGEAMIVDLAAALRQACERPKADEAADPKQQWLKLRESCIGASEVATVCGVGFGSPYELWARKCGFLPPLDETEAMEWGNRLEPLVAQAYADKFKRTLIDHGRYAFRVAPQWPFLGATLDREIVAIDDDGPGALECKTTGAHRLEEWDGDEPPLRYQLQVQAQLAVTGFRWGVLACLIGGQRFRAFRIERRDDAIKAIVERCRVFWQHVATATPPPVDGSEATRRALDKIYARPSDDETAKELPAALADATARYIAASAAIKAAEAEKRQAENEIKDAMGTAVYGVIPGVEGRWHWGLVEAKGYTVAPKSYRKLQRVK